MSKGSTLTALGNGGGGGLLLRVTVDGTSAPSLRKGLNGNLPAASLQPRYRPRQSLSADNTQSCKRFPGPPPPLPTQTKRKSGLCLLGIVMNRCRLADISVTGRCFRIGGGVEPLSLGLISGAHTAPPWGSQTWGGWGFSK